MGDQIISSIVTIATAIIGIAIIAVLVSNNANTAGVLTAATGGFGQDLLAAEAPVTGGGSGFGMGGFTGGSGTIPTLM